MIKNTQTYNLILMVVFFLNVIVLQTCSFVGPILKSILVGSLVSFIFYFIVVYVPTYLRKKNLKRVFLRFYDQFKNDILWEVLELAEFSGDKYKKNEELKDTDKFIEFAGESSRKKGQTNWHVLMNNIDKKKYQHSLKTIIVKLSELQRETDFLVRTVGVEDEELLHKFRNLDRGLQDGRFKEELDWNWGEDKSFCDSIYELLSGASMIGGKHGDFIKKWVEKL